MDIWSKEKRSQVMSRILSRDTTPERRARKILTAMGYRYRLNVKDLPGKPDIVLRKYNAVIFVHGCFWHLHSGCRDGTVPKSRTDYWREKLYKNKARDVRHNAKLAKARLESYELLGKLSLFLDVDEKRFPEALRGFLGLVEDYNNNHC